MEVKKVKILSALLSFLAIAGANSEVFFNGEAGIQSSLGKSEESSELGMNINGFVSGQISFTNNFFVQSEISVKTSDLLDKGLFKDVSAAFSFNEFSAHYVLPVFNLVHRFSFFVGNADPIGKESYINHQFGLKDFSSPIMETFIGKSGLSIYPMFGTGFSYNLKLSSAPVSLGAYIYKNKENDDEDSQPNFDFRIATAMKYFTMDFAIGAGIPFSRKNGDEDVVLLIDKIYLHTGLTMLIGNKSTNSLFIQSGFSHLEFSSASDITNLKPENLFVLFEPRFKSNLAGCNITIFNLPKELLSTSLDEDDPMSFSYDNLTYIEDSFGLNFMVYSDKLNIKTNIIRIGSSFMFSFKDKYINDLSDSDFSDAFSMKVMPFVEARLPSGNINATIQVKPTEWSQSKVTIGYKTTI